MYLAILRHFTLNKAQLFEASFNILIYEPYQTFVFGAAEITLDYFR